MKEKDNYYCGFSGTEEHLDYFKHGVLNDFGYNIDYSSKEKYNIDKIIKTSHSRVLRKEEWSI